MKFLLFQSLVLSTKLLSPPVLIAHSDVKLFHEGPIYDPELNTVLISSDIIDNSDNHRPGSASTVLDLSNGKLVSYNSIFTKIPYANGGIRTPSSGYIILGQGDYDRDAGLYLLNPKTMIAKPLLTKYEGQGFNSPNDIVMMGNQVYFTDPEYGYLQGFRPRLNQPSAVYRCTFDPQTETIVDIQRILETHMFDKPNGIAISPDGKTILVSDSGYYAGDGSVDTSRPHDVYAWNTSYLDRHVWQRGFVHQPARLIYRTVKGIPDGIKFDSQGRFWVANYGGEGILQIDYQTGKVLAKIPIEGGGANFAFVKGKGGDEEMVIMGDSNLWMHDLQGL